MIAKPFTDAELLSLIQEIRSHWLHSFGYRAVHALLCLAGERHGRAPLNHKRVYRIMRQHGLLLPRR